MNLLIICGPQIRICVFTLRIIASKQLNSLSTIETASWLGGAVVTHPLLGQEVLNLIPVSGKGFYVWLFCSVVADFSLFVKKEQHLLFTKCFNFFCYANFFSILNILQDLWPNQRAKRYRPSIFKRRNDIWVRNYCLNSLGIMATNLLLKVYTRSAYYRISPFKNAFLNC